MRSTAGSSGVRSSGASFWGILVALLGFAALTHWLDDPPAPLPIDAPATSFSAARAAAELQSLLAENVPHPLASAADERVRSRIVGRLSELGIATELHSGWVCDRAFACGKVVNIVARIEGSDPASGAVLLAAHYDSVPAGPGASDDGIGVASILEIARVLREQPVARHPIILLIDEGEETGLLGAQLFVDSHPLAKTVKAVVNLEARGDSGPSLMFETGAATDFSMRLFAHAVARPKSNSLYYFIYRLLPNDTDFTVFKQAGFEGFNFALIGNVERYHTPQDTLANLDLGSLQHQGQNGLASLQALAAADLSHMGTGGAVFFDVFGRKLLHWPSGAAPAIGIVLVVFLLVAAWNIRRRVGIPALGIVYALAASLASWLGVTLAAAVLLSLVRASGAAPPAEAYGWAAHPLGMHAACVALALLAPLVAVRIFARRTDAWSLWIANLLLLCAFALLCSLWFAELSFLFIVPVAAAVLGGAWVLRELRHAGGAAHLPALAVALPVLGAAFTLLPSMLMTYTALGADAWPIITLICGLIALGLAPLLVDVRSLTHRTAFLLAAVGIVLGVALMLLQSPYSTEMPQRTLLWYALDADGGNARWILQPDSKRSAPQLDFDATGAHRDAALPTGIVSGLHVATAPRLDYAAPEFTTVDVKSTGTGTTYRLRLRSVRTAPEIELALPSTPKVVSATIVDGERRIPAHFWRAPNGIQWLDIYGAADAPIDLELTLPDGEQHALHVLDRSYGLPPEGAALRAAGPALTTASQDGDLAIVYRSATLGPAPFR